jgi:CoA:oxalate CoA-transferase
MISQVVSDHVADQAQAQASGGPLSHLRVLDLTLFLSGPWATQILGDLGAEVIKIELPAGDLTRHLPPHFIHGESVYYLSTNRNKSSLVLDLKNPEGADLLRRLALESDVVVENFRPGVCCRASVSIMSACQNSSQHWCGARSQVSARTGLIATGLPTT